MSDFLDKGTLLRQAIDQADAVLIGAGSGLSAAAGLTYSGERFQRYFADFAERFGIRDMYSGGFYPFPDLETYWGWWSRHIWYNRFDVQENGLYAALHETVCAKDHFVITTNVDHQFQAAGFADERLFCTQGDYGLIQCKDGCHTKTYDCEALVREMIATQEHMRVPTELVPRCPVCGKPMVAHLRCDDTFVEDDGWHAMQERYSRWVGEHASGKVLYLELGVGLNTPAWIKYPFWRMTQANPLATYVCCNYGEVYAPGQIADRSLLLDGDIAELLLY
ncbi:MAG: Sir2 silent information regulator family NAD-dependent deacetylase [Coriobacteriia bacterium]|nr:Sir2 silent information regulator family NAD-dependent deacetylase [Coriobacteriia bacterium]